MCRSGLRGYDEAFCYGAYDGALRQLIHLLKYSGMRPLAQPLGAMMANALPRDRKFDVVTPVPLHWFRRWNRGFNQAGLLGKVLAKRRGIRFANLLRRRAATRSQAGLGNSQRRENVAAAFTARHRVAGQRILLIDDVLTTGATAAACARALKKAGAKSVSLLTLARVDRRLTNAGSSKRKGPFE